MFDAKEVITAAARCAVALFRTHRRGDTVTWAQLEQATGITRLSPHWTALNRRFRRDFLRATGVALWPVPSVGLQLVTHEFQLKDLPRLRQQRACRQYTRSLNAVRALPDEQLSPHQRAAKQRKIEQLRTARRAALQSIRLGNVVARASSNGLPRPSKAV